MRLGRDRAQAGTELPPVKRESFPRRILVFDTEANRDRKPNGEEIQTLNFGVARFLQLGKDLSVLQDTTYDFKTAEEFYGILTQCTRKDVALYVYAHNIKYDLALSDILRVMLSEHWKISKFVMNDPPTFIRIARNSLAVIFVDTFNYWQSPLSAMGEQLGLSKLAMPSEDAPWAQWLEYCKRDVDVLAEYLLRYMRWLKVNDLGGMALTLAGQAFRTYRHSFLQTPIIYHDDAGALALERDGYMGARTEAFRIGDLSGTTWAKLDINSMYPFVMLSEDYPVKLVARTEDLPLGRLSDLLARYYVIARVDLDTDIPAYAMRHEGKLIYPIGRFETVLHHRELNYALERGHILAIKELAIYERGPIFGDYINYFYERKKAADISGDKVERQQAKLLMNSLYGKFGQRGVSSTMRANDTGQQFGRVTGYSESLGEAVTVHYLGDVLEVTYPTGESYYSYPAIAGAVTANARHYLWTLITLAGREHVIYCDTDSLFVDAIGRDRLEGVIDAHRLGALKVEGVSDRMVIHGLKDYEYGEEKHVKGVPKSAKAIDDDTWAYAQFQGGLTWLNSGMLPQVTVKTVTKHRSGNYTKGTILPDGRIEPLRF
mgnify:CR=1 FL=1